MSSSSPCNRWIYSACSFCVRHVLAQVVQCRIWNETKQLHQVPVGRVPCQRFSRSQVSNKQSNALIQMEVVRKKMNINLVYSLLCVCERLGEANEKNRDRAAVIIWANILYALNSHVSVTFFLARVSRVSTLDGLHVAMHAIYNHIRLNYLRPHLWHLKFLNYFFFRSPADHRRHRLWRNFFFGILWRQQQQQLPPPFRHGDVYEYNLLSSIDGIEFTIAGTSMWILAFACMPHINGDADCRPLVDQIHRPTTMQCRNCERDRALKWVSETSTRSNERANLFSSSETAISTRKKKRNSKL